MGTSPEEIGYDYYAPVSKLGMRGVTEPCTRAMMAILTSALRPTKITAVIEALAEKPSVLFLVWDWPIGLTIVPDGFGTHGGEAGGGLSDVLGLIRYSTVPLDQVMVEQEVFEELAEGHLTKEIFELVCDSFPYDWNFYSVSDVQQIKSGKNKRVVIVRGKHQSRTIELL